MSELTDLEICKKIADIIGAYYIETKYYDIDNFLGLVNEPDGTGTPPELIGEFNPLTDDALCFKLMVEYCITFYKSGLENDPYFYACCSKRPSNLRYTIYDENPNRVICLAIIGSHEGEQ